LAGNFKRLDPASHLISEIAEGKFLRGFGE
jgi:hypothetical protein